MDKIWQKNYPEGVPHEINPDRYPSISAIFEESCKTYSQRPAISNLDKIVTYGELDKLSMDFAAYLQNHLGLQKGDRIAIMMPNLLQYPVVLFAALRAGLIIVNVNPLYTARELVHQLSDAEATSIVVLANFAHVLQQALPETPIKNVMVTQVGDLLPFPKSLMVNSVVKHIKKMVPAWDIPEAILFNQVLRDGSQQTLTPVDICGDDIAFLQYTGGTTGVSKGAILTHRNMVANVEQVAAWVKPTTIPGKEVIITALPLYHIFCLTSNCLAFLKYGAHNVLITNPRDIPSFIKEMAKVKFTAITGVNTLFNALLNNDEFKKLDFSSLKLALGGGMSVHKAVADKWAEVTGGFLSEGYGLTETSPVVTINPLGLKRYTGSIGVPVPSVDVEIRDKDKAPVPLGEVGELTVKGPQVMRGYWNRPEETAKAVTADGWFSTGDIATMDAQGYVRIVDRKKDLIIVSGFNVYPNEVESVIAMHSGVLEVAVIGVPHDVSGETVKAVVVKKNDELTGDDVISHCRKSLTAYKVPKVVEFRDDLPKSNVGKILRRALRD